MKTRLVVSTGCAAALLWVFAACTDDGNATGLQCPTGSAICGDASPACSNLQGDPLNCGACGNACAHGEICDLGGCTGMGFDAGKPAEASSDAPREATDGGPG